MTAKIDKIYSMISLAKKAGKIITGSDVCEKAIKKEKVKVLIISEDSSESTAKKFTDMCNYRSIPCIKFGERKKLGRYTGKDEIVVCGICDNGFSNIITKLIEESLAIGGNN